MNQDQFRAKTLALFHSLVSSWSSQLREDVTRLQDQLIGNLDTLQEQLAKYEDHLDEGRIVAFAQELEQATAGAPAGDGGKLAQVKQSMAVLDEGAATPEVLGALVNELAHFASRVALFVLKEGACIGWAGQGFDQTPGFSNEALRRISVPSNADTVFRAVVVNRTSFLGESTVHKDNVQLLTRIGNVLPSSLFAMPLIMKDRVAAVIYADSGDSRDPLTGMEAIEILVTYAGRLLDSRTGGGAKPPGKSTQELAKARKEPAVRPAPPPHVAPSLGLSSSPGYPPPSPVPQPVSPPMQPEVSSPGPMVESNDGIEIEIEPEDAGTVMINPTDMSDLTGQSPSAPAPPPQTAPPLEQMDADTRKHHEDAKRFARLLVSEIKLYNEAKVQQGRSSRNLYHQLKDDIERSRQLYSERVPGAVRDSSDYFNDELVRILAEGDGSLMGSR